MKTTSKIALLSALLFLPAISQEAERVTAPSPLNLQGLSTERAAAIISTEVKNSPSSLPEIVSATVDAVGLSAASLPTLITAAVEAHPQPALAYDAAAKVVAEKAVPGLADVAAKYTTPNDPRSFPAGDTKGQNASTVPVPPPTVVPTPPIPTSRS